MRVDPRLPAASECVVARLLERRATETPDKLFALFENNVTWTYAQALNLARRTAKGMRDLGVKAGDYVNVWMPNGPDAVRIWLGAAYIGAVFVPINTAYRGRILEHVLANTEARLMIVHAELAPRLRDVALARLETAVVFGDLGAQIDGLKILPKDTLFPAEEIEERATIAPWDTHAVIFTSGTTGPSKGVLVSNAHFHANVDTLYSHIGADDRMLVTLPIYHVTGVGMMMLTLMRGASFALVTGFTTSEFWKIVREKECTETVLLGVMASFLLRQPPGPADREHTLRHAMMVPLNEEADAFAARFGCNIYTAYNMTETSTPLMMGPNPKPAGTCGRPRKGVEVRIVDENDCEVPVGEVGELIVRTDAPWAMNSGYLRNPEATARAWRNGWFHTGDAFRMDAEGNYFFVDRMKDAIRRRGENISSFEVEAEVCSHPAVREAAAVAVASEMAEDEVLVAISLAPEAELNPADLIAYLIPRMPHFMVPRYIRVLPDLPKTPTLKVQKYLLREQGITSDTFDREKAGIAVKRELIRDRST